MPEIFEEDNTHVPNPDGYLNIIDHSMDAVKTYVDAHENDGSEILKVSVMTLLDDLNATPDKNEFFPGVLAFLTKYDLLNVVGIDMQKIFKEDYVDGLESVPNTDGYLNIDHSMHAVKAYLDVHGNDGSENLEDCVMTLLDDLNASSEKRLWFPAVLAFLTKHDLLNVAGIE